MTTSKNRQVDLVAIFRRHERKFLRTCQQSDLLEKDIEQELRKDLAEPKPPYKIDLSFGILCSYQAERYRYRLLLGQPDPWDDLAQAGIYCLAAMLASITDNLVRRSDWNNLNPASGAEIILLADHYGVAIDRSAPIFADPQGMPAGLAVLAEWRTPDLERVDALASGLADLHIRCSQQNLLPKPYWFIDFDDGSFPYEILAWLRFREWAGLPNPSHFSHPLLQGPQAVLPPRNWPRPEMPLLVEAIKKNQQLYPERNVLNRLLEVDAPAYPYHILGSPSRPEDQVALYRLHEQRFFAQMQREDLLGKDLDRELRETLAQPEIPQRIDTVFDNLVLQYANRYRYRLLLGQSDPWDDLAQAGSYRLAEMLAIITSNFNGGREGLLPISFAQLIGYLAVSDRQPELRLFFESFLEFICTKVTSLLHPKVGPIFTFLFLLLAESYGEPIDRNRNASVFADPEGMPESLAVLAEWRTPDLERVDALASGLADLHIRYSQPSSLPKPYEVPELFEDASFPYEILAWLRLREWAGLPNPSHFSHPLLQGVQAVLPPRNRPRPEMPLLVEAIEKYHQKFPEHNVLDRLLALWKDSE